MGSQLSVQEESPNAVNAEANAVTKNALSASLRDSTTIKNSKIDSFHEAALSAPKAMINHAIQDVKNRFGFFFYYVLNV
jgi:hypothetical protein